MAIGIGDMRIVDTEQGIWDGEAIYLSGRALEEMSSLNKGTMSVQTSNKQLSAPLQTIALLADAILNDMGLHKKVKSFTINCLVSRGRHCYEIGYIPSQCK